MDILIKKDYINNLNINGQALSMIMYKIEEKYTTTNFEVKKDSGWLISGDKSKEAHQEFIKLVDEASFSN